MPTQDLQIPWEWPAGRQIESKLLVHIQKISKASKGILGIGASPSLANAIPDATDVAASIVAGPKSLIGLNLSMRLPGMEANKLKVGKHAVIGLAVGEIVCVFASPEIDGQHPENWLSQWDCPSPRPNDEVMGLSINRN